MYIGGIIAEYNPFHNGHLYQINKLHEKCNTVVIVMSGSFVQRGDVAITDKFTRAKAAVLNGADLVVELPAAYSLSSAKQFAYGGVSILKALGVDMLCFGSESGDISSMLKAADILENETEEQSLKIKELMKSGINYPAAVTNVFSEIDSNILSKPNNILGLEYIRACRAIGYSPEYFPIKRFMTDHDSNTPKENIASASYIRSLIYKNKDYFSYVPKYDINDIRSRATLDTAVISAIRIKKSGFFAPNTDIPESVKNKIVKGAFECNEISELTAYAKSKSVTAARINRAVLASFLGINGSLSKTEPSYIRVLAMNKKGAAVLKNTENIDIITKTADYKKDNEMFEKDILASDISALCGKRKKGNTDYTISPFFSTE